MVEKICKNCYYWVGPNIAINTKKYEIRMCFHTKMMANPNDSCNMFQRVVLERADELNLKSKIKCREPGEKE